MHFFVTGINGFVGTHFCEYLLRSGHRVSGSFSTTTGAHRIKPGVQGHKYALGKPIPSDLFREVDYVVHLAWSLNEADIELNLAGTQSLVEAARAQGVKRQIFVSSYSATAEAVSAYGKGKFRAEGVLSDPDLVIIRPGLVIGKGGLCLKMVNTVSRLPVVPILGGNSIHIPIIGISHLCEAIVRVVDLKEKAWNLYYEPQVSMRFLLQTFAIRLRLRPVFLNIPIMPVFYFVRLLEICRIRLPIKSENIVGLLASQRTESRSNLSVLNLTDKDWRDDFLGSREERSNLQ
ncbi:MAG: NAD-dependent epimerase/dehydratase family protein [Bdellovibrionales bacterium]|nr:NAD-dependent epimerase/dehydratase family protein [Bdellovibrionales bacterium]